MHRPVVHRGLKIVVEPVWDHRMSRLDTVDQPARTMRPGFRSALFRKVSASFGKALQRFASKDVAIHNVSGAVARSEFDGSLEIA